MGYLANSTVTVEAILTKKGRELLARGQGFDITQFAVADDEIDYSLWAPTHPLGTAYYGIIIESLPLVEAVPDETQVMRYKLVSLPRGTNQIPIISLGFTSISLQFGVNNSFPIRPTTSQGLNGPGFGYTAILFDSDSAVLVGTGLPSNFSASTPAFFGDTSTANATVAVGLEFTLTPKNVSSDTQTQISIIGNQSGASITIPVTVKAQTTN